MNRSGYFNLIERNLDFLAFRIQNRGRLNLLELHLHSENFYLYLINMVFDYQLENINAQSQNTAGIDLVDKINHVVVQVSASATKQKIESALDKVPKAFKKYSFKFIPIVSNASHLCGKTYLNSNKIPFDSNNDIIDITMILRRINTFTIEKLKEIAYFIKKELVIQPDPIVVESNLADIIAILAQDDLSQTSGKVNVNAFEIEEKNKFNALDKTGDIIDDFMVHHPRVEKNIR